MKVLILTVSAGEGHNSIGRAVGEYLKEKAEVLTYDIFKGKNWIKAKIANEGYFFVCKHFYNISNRWYNKVKNTDYSKTKRAVIHCMVKQQKKQVLSLLHSFCPDAVFCTHVECACIMSDLKEEGKTSVKTVSVITDFDVQPYTETSCHVDYIVVPNEEFIAPVEKKGFSRAQILPLGIPVGGKFSEKISKTEVRQKLGLDSNKFTIYLMSGGVGFVDNVDLIKSLTRIKDQIQIICVSGRNQRLKKRVDRLLGKSKYPPILSFGYVNNVHELMSASDCIIGKTGGVSLCESINKLLPIVATEKLPWQEWFNMQYLKEKGGIIYMENQKKAVDYILPLIEKSELAETMKENMRKIQKPHAAKDVAEFILGMI